MIISRVVHTAVCERRTLGAPVVFVDVHEFVAGLYRPPVLSYALKIVLPPQTIISLPDQIAVWKRRGLGAPVVFVAAHESAIGLYRPPVLK